MACRVQPFLNRLIRPNQIGFLKGRSILDNAFLSMEMMNWAIESKQPMVMLLLDFKKMNNKIELGFLERTMRAMGFNREWIKWI